MRHKPKYLFKSERLGFRKWKNSDVDPMAAISADAEVMKHFPATKTHEETQGFIGLMNEQLADLGHCFFAVDLLETSEFIGFIGLSTIMYHIDFAPAVEIGWRLAPTQWNKGLATEGAAQCIHYGFETLGLDKVVSVAPQVNEASIKIMNNIGMTHVKDFEHPLLKEHEGLKDCVLYSISPNLEKEE